MRLSLIGMSGIGKSHWSRQLVGHGFQRFCCDDLIATRLDAELTQPDGTVIEMGEWMGFPYQATYASREQRYLALEVEVLTEVLDHLAQTVPTDGDNLIIDTTGSVIYTPPDLLARLAELTTMVYLEAPLQVQEQMCQAYMIDPPPVLWRNKYHRLAGESERDALIRCYPDLLTSRAQAYEQLAQVTLDYYQLRQADFTADNFLEEVSKIGMVTARVATSR